MIANKTGLPESDIKAIQNCLAEHPEAESAVIFGSRALGSFDQGSDVDIALFGDKLSLDIINRIGYKLNEETRMPYRFDVINYHTLRNDALKDHIDRVGVRFL